MARLALATIFALLAVAAPALAADAAVTASGTTFSPASVTIATGDKVTWTRTSGFHNVKFTDGEFEQPAAPSDGWTTVERTFAGAGTYTYFCEAHQELGMTGTVVVETPGTAYTWVGANNGSWETGANWSPAGVPGTSPTDTATIGDGDAVLMSGDHTVKSLTLQGSSTRAGAGTLTLTGASTWTNGNTGPGKTIVAATGQLTWNGGNLTQGEVENLGRLTVGGIELGNTLAGANPAVLDNQGTAVMTGNVTDGNAGQAVVQNPGQLSGVGTIGPPLSNSGMVTASGGTLELTGSVPPNPGAYSAAAGATLRFSGSTTGEAEAKVTGAGTVEVTGALTLPPEDASGWVVPGLTRVTGELSVGGGSTGSLDLDGTLVADDPFVATGGTNTWFEATVGGNGPVTVQGATTVDGLAIVGVAKLRMEGATTLVGMSFGDGDGITDAAPELLLAGPTTLAIDASFGDGTAGGAPKLAVLAGGSLALGTKHLTLPAPFSTAGTLGVQLDSASVFGQLTAPSVTLGGDLAVSGAFKPVAPLRVITTPAEPTGSFASVTSGFETLKDATGVLLKTAPVVEPTASPTPGPTPTATATASPSPTPTAAPTPTVQPLPIPKFGSLVKLPKCAARRSLRVQVRAPAASARVLLKRKLIKTIRGTKAVTLRKLPKRAFVLSFEVKLRDGRVVKGSKKFRACK